MNKPEWFGPSHVGIFWYAEGHWSKSNQAVAFTQRDPTVLRWIQEEYGGHLRTVHSQQSECYRLTLRRHEMEKFRQEVGPYTLGRLVDPLG